MNDPKTSRAGRLAGKVALITGAGPGLGGVIAAAMADEGARLVLCDIDPQALQVTGNALKVQGARCRAALRCLRQRSGGQRRRCAGCHALRVGRHPGQQCRAHTQRAGQARKFPCITNT